MSHLRLEDFRECERSHVPSADPCVVGINGVIRQSWRQRLPNRRGISAMKHCRVGRANVSSWMSATFAAAIALSFWSWKSYPGHGRAWLSRSASFELEALVFCASGLALIFVVCALFCRGAINERAVLRRCLKGAWWAYVLAAIWFHSVEWCYYYDFCARCHNRRATLQYRVLSVPIQTTVKAWGEPTLIGYIAADLGIPCSHGRFSRNVITRLAGLCMCVQRGGTYLVNTGWYPECARRQVLSWKETDPGFVLRFRKRVMDEHDLEYWRGLRRQLFIACGQKNPL
jgi:hypothetical protein